ncbi:Stk1 family PASTA domain-containing Ser/Thr kinase [Paenibacillus radicis (ex Gao et al. 2016)]|uniref:Serine/threonine-protein kinase PrkC n=1 Tax=Paenibacillus radicis (ex Gao et al. 2016) TaxID=1737354 RepID=A0A917M7N1_9BACL|nr:Stk1 family PASTA domain-containing Ser/Thr kinase [Paenibacillus radicis (ex Gao et al. 2016)]GGG82702.1 serine/threonine-protein kinase PrkC [Paenibacillus radicis (ex Gao et al. 2016)]
MIGHDLGGRYEILTRIGGGGMALVYKAHDVLLNRNVAVKVLRQQFVHDEEFIRRFRREAQSAASLSHPNVVSIYDVGQEDDTHYIVMEYIEGHNLNEIIQERAPLQTDEAVRIAVQICDALDHAHQNHIIHRDIKPHNILIGKNGRVKVTDFGIARAATASTITQTGSVIGSVHYFSPEHAKGVNTGEKSDLYSLGIVIYQMLTGKLPFLGESPISVALKHLQEDFESPRVVNPHIPQSVENIILKATRKNQSERYNSAHEMLLDLDSCLKPERLNEPKATFVSDSDLDETRVMPAIRGDFRPSPPPPSMTPPPVERLERDRSSAQPNDSKRKEESAATKKPMSWKRTTSIVVITLVALALIVWGFTAVLKKLDVAEVKVPYVVGKQLKEAREELEAAGLSVEDPVTEEFKADIPAGQVYEQTKANMLVKKGSFIHLSVSKGAELEKLSEYKGQKLQVAKDELSALGVDVEDRSVFKVEELYSDQDAGTIINQTPAAGTEFNPKDVQFTFMVSKGRETFPMPNLVGKTVAEAKDEIRAYELVLNNDDILYEPSYDVKKGIVIDSDPYKYKDPVSKGKRISIRVSSGPPADAKEHQFNITISPTLAGKTSEIRIVYSDAQGETVEWGKRQISDTQTFPVKVLVRPDGEATVFVYRDGQYVDKKTITYAEITKGSGSTTVTIPGADPTPPPVIEVPTDTDPVETQGLQTGNNGGDGEHTDEQH